MPKMSKVLAVYLALALAFSPGMLPAQSSDPDLAAGIRQVNEGDFEAALLTLDGAVRRLQSEPGRSRDLAQAYLYLGIAYLGLDQEQPARTKFREALAHDRSLRLSPDRYPPKVIRVFDAALQEVGITPADTSRPAPQPQRQEPTRSQAPQKKGGSKLPWILLGVGAVGAGAALALGGGGGDSGPRIQTQTFNSTNVGQFISDFSTILSTLNVSGMNGTITSLTCAVNISHTFQGDLIVGLRHPTGVEAILHNRTGGSLDNIINTFPVGQFNGQPANGIWTLRVSDQAFIDVGRLNTWGITVTTQR